MNILIAYLMGLVFGLGLCVSQMIDPVRVIGFLDIFGSWDPTLASVMLGAVSVMALGYAIVRKRTKPIFGNQFFIPTAKELDWKLILGSILFGVGWGLAGFCPGPAVVSLAFGIEKVYLFFYFLLIGMGFYHLIFIKFLNKKC